MIKSVEFEGETFDFRQSTNEASIRDLKELLRVSGISMAKVAATFKGMRDIDSQLDVYDTEERLDLFAAVLFLCKRKAGYREFTWEDAQDAPMSHISLIVEVTEGDDADPKVSDPQTPAVLEESESPSSPT